MANYDLLGNIAIVKFKREVNKKNKQKFALSLMKKNNNIKTVLEKSERFKGRLRTLKTKYILGEKTKEALYKENNCIFRLNVDTCYFSPRLATERKEIADAVKKGEKVLVLFGGVAPFAIVSAKKRKAGKIVSIELGKECNKYAKENVKRNKADVEIIQGDARKKLPLLKEKFDRIVMPRPNLKDSFLDIVFPRIKSKGIVHYYGFYDEKNVGELEKMIIDEAKKAGKKIKILKIKKAGDIGARKFRYRADFRVMD